MSAFICSHAHIDAIVRWASVNRVSAQYENPTRIWRVQGQEQETCETLHATNVDSFNHRYKEELLPDTFVYNSWARGLKPVEVIKAVQCLVYQSGEHPEWKTSKARTICKEILQVAISKLPGYDDAEWSID